MMNITHYMSVFNILMRLNQRASTLVCKANKTSLRRNYETNIIMLSIIPHQHEIIDDTF